MGVVAGERADLHRSAVGLNAAKATTLDHPVVPVRPGEQQSIDATHLDREVVHQIRRLDLEVPRLWPPPSVHVSGNAQRPQLEA